MKTRIAAAQIAPCFLDLDATVEKACRTIEIAAKEGAKLLVFPEAFISGYPDWVWVVPNSKGALLGDLYAELLENAVSVPDNTTEKL